MAEGPQKGRKQPFKDLFASFVYIWIPSEAKLATLAVCDDSQHPVLAAVRGDIKIETASLDAMSAGQRLATGVDRCKRETIRPSD
jgi:hypothetical protein